jgi:hypothetical protein
MQPGPRFTSVTETGRIRAAVLQIASVIDLSMISEQKRSAFVEVKPLHAFPDHAL